MIQLKCNLLSTTVLPTVMGAGVVLAMGVATVPCGRASSNSTYTSSGQANPEAVPAPSGAAAGCSTCGACSACSPCAAPCGACNPCQIYNPCGGCGTCGACNSCEICNPCGACGGYNPCAACAACNPCAVCDTCNPCAVYNLCNPCAAACGGCGACGACNPCAAVSGCEVPRLVWACNPCGGCGACSACGASLPEPSPSGYAAGCGACGAFEACGACGAGADVELTNEEAQAAYDCIKGQLYAGYEKAGVTSDKGLDISGHFMAWDVFNTVAYKSWTHGGRFANNYANAVASDAYSTMEGGGTMPVGSIMAKDSFGVTGKGIVVAGPLFLMEKMPEGFNADSGDWRYTLVMPNGKVIGTTNGEGSGNVAFCIDCHVYAERDSMLFVPEEYRM